MRCTSTLLNGFVSIPQKIQVPTDPQATYVCGASSQFTLPIILHSQKSTPIPVKALVDSSCTGSTIDAEFAKQNQIPLILLKRCIQVKNMDGTPNSCKDLSTIRGVSG